MKALTISERQSIHDILRGNLQDSISELNAKDPGWAQRIEDRKRKVAIGRLKVQKDVSELEQLEANIRDLEAKRKAVELRIKKKMPLGERGYRGACPDNKDLCEAISEICEEIHDQEQAKDKTGKLVLKLQKEHQQKLTRLAKCDTRQDVAEAGVLD
jgi:chaperonin cofactor prefoldin